MRILLVTAPFKSHLYVQVPLAWALRTAGHEVRIAGAPGVAGDIVRAGHVAVPVGTPIRLDEQMAAAEPVATEAADRSVPPGSQRRDPVKPSQGDYAVEDPHGELESNVHGWRTLFNPDSAFDDLVRFALDWRPDLVISDTFMFIGAVAARATGAAYVRMLFGADGLAQLRAACRRVPGDHVDPLRDWLEPFLARYGSGFDEEVVLGQCTVFPMPRWIWRPDGVRYLPMRHVPFNGTGATPEWLTGKPDRARVCLTLGLAHREDNHGVTATAADLFEAVADLDVEVVATFNAKQLETASSVPDNVRVVDFAPMNLLLPTCDAVIHSGGAGTFASALENAVPQLIVPNVYWSEKWWGSVAMANGIQERGAGLYVGDADQVTAAGLRESLDRVLTDPSFKENAVALRTETQGMPSPNEVVPLLEKLTAEHRVAIAAPA